MEQQIPSSPKSERRWRRPGPVLIALAVGLAAGSGGVWIATRGSGHVHREGDQDEAKKGQRYTCPMHPTVVMDHPGECPICGMQLVPMQDQSAPPAASVGERKIAFYRSPMDPKQTSPVPRQDEMGMDYLPVYQDEAKGGAGPVEGLATVAIDPARQQLIGLQTAEVQHGAVGGTWRTVGRVQVDPTRVRRINVKVEGYVEQIMVDFVGQPVRKGQSLFRLYSPELLSTQSEYLLALKTRRALESGGALSESGETLVAAARQKLKLWDVPDSEIERLERTSEPSKTLTFVSPIAGVVTAKNVVEGSRLSLLDTPYEITDLSTVWVMADAYETDLGRVRVGMRATLSLAAYPDRTFKGEVAFLDPLLDPKTRTLKVHLHFPNPRGELKPEMFGEVVLQGKARTGLTIPADSVIRTGTQDVVFVAVGEGKFQPHQVELGSKTGDQVEVVKGLVEGQKVVTRANFLVDSESRLRASLAALDGK